MNSSVGMKEYGANRYVERPPPPPLSYTQPSLQRYHDYHAGGAYKFVPDKLSRSHPQAPLLSPGRTKVAINHALSRNYRTEYSQTPPIGAQPLRPTASNIKQMDGHEYRASADYDDPYAKYARISASSDMPSNLPSAMSSGHIERFAHPLSRREQTLPKAPPSHSEIPASSTSTKRPSLECTVCGPEAIGPWRRGPIGPYTLCDTCARIDWKEDGVAVPANVHEALSLLDNMRLIRLASVIRKGGDRAQMELARRLQNGLPESTYAKAEEYFARQTKADATQPPAISAAAPVTFDPRPSTQQINNVDLAHRENRVQTVAPVVQSSDDARVGQKRRSNPEDPIASTNVVGGRGSYSGDEHRDKRTVGNPSLKPRAGPSGLSPQSMTVAAPMIQQAEGSKGNPRTPLTPVRTQGTTAENRTGSDSKQKKDGIATISIDSAMPTFPPTPKLTDPPSARSEIKTSSPALTAAVAQLAIKAFPFRDADHFRQTPKARIIDRRRARNEALRQKYLSRRVEQQRSREVKPSEPDTQVKQSSSNNATKASSPRAVDTPGSEASAKVSHGTPDIVEPPASLRDILEASRDSS